MIGAAASALTTRPPEGALPAARILILFAHPAFERSRVHRRLAAAARAQQDVTFHDLYEAYPDFDIDVRREQELLLAHDLIVLQHPFHWYSAPPLVKQWIDLVLEYGWAYGERGTALRGKRMLSAISAGGHEASYDRSGSNHFTVRELLAPLTQTARLCGFEILPPFLLYGTHDFDAAAIARAADDYGRLLAALREGRVDLDTARALPRINADLGALLA
jgi:glutathione-regulated potassium-efflux system ancillary protein KefG